MPARNLLMRFGKERRRATDEACIFCSTPAIMRVAMPRSIYPILEFAGRDGACVFQAASVACSRSGAFFRHVAAEAQAWFEFRRSPKNPRVFRGLSPHHPRRLRGSIPGNPRKLRGLVGDLGCEVLWIWGSSRKQPFPKKRRAMDDCVPASSRAA